MTDDKARQVCEAIGWEVRRGLAMCYGPDGGQIVSCFAKSRDAMALIEAEIERLGLLGQYTAAMSKAMSHGRVPTTGLLITAPASTRLAAAWAIRDLIREQAN